MNDVVGILQLKGKDAYNFAYSLFRPSKEMMERIKSSAYAIGNIVISKSGNGFEAEIEELDLSFLDEISNENNITVETEMYINISGMVNKGYAGDSHMDILDNVGDDNIRNSNRTMVNRLTICDDVKYSNIGIDELFIVAA